MPGSAPGPGPSRSGVGSLNAVVTGANRGIGLEIARILAERGERVFAACRRRSPELDALPVRVIDAVDVSDDRSVTALRERLQAEPIDLLINNAGLLRYDRLDNLDWDGIRRQFEVNTLGPLRVSAALGPSMRRGGKIGIVSSRVGSLADNTSGGLYGYRISKAAVNMVGVNLARDFKPRGIAVYVLHPGYVRTAMTGGAGHVDPHRAAQGLIERLDNLKLADTGTFWHAQGHPLPW